VSLIRKPSIALVAVVAAVSLALAAGTASASTSGAHFTATATSVNSSGSLVATFSEAGLGNENVHYTLTANATATYACINGGGNHPKAANKENVNATVNGGADIQAKNGHASGGITAGYDQWCDRDSRGCSADVLQYRLALLAKALGRSWCQSDERCRGAVGPPAVFDLRPSNRRNPRSDPGQSSSITSCRVRRAV